MSRVGVGRHGSLVVAIETFLRNVGIDSCTILVHSIGTSLALNGGSACVILARHYAVKVVSIYLGNCDIVVLCVAEGCVACDAYLIVDERVKLEDRKDEA